MVSSTLNPPSWHWVMEEKTNGSLPLSSTLSVVS